MDASAEERARRRYEERRKRGQSADYDDILAAVRTRDAIDSSRTTAPLRIAPDAIVIDTDDLSIDEVVARVEELAREHLD